MARRRRNQNSDLPVILDLKTDSTDRNFENISACSHVNKALDINTVKKAVIKGGGFLELACLSCSRNKVYNPSNGDNLCLCLKCGSCYCGDHVTDHTDAPRSDIHHVLLQLNTVWTVRCYKCNEDIQSNRTSKLESCLSLLKQIYDRNVSNKSAKNDKSQCKIVPEAITELTKSMEAECSLNYDQSTFGISSIPLKYSSNSLGARGLSNLGNTCFFNSVLQCLAQTPFLLEALQETCKAGQKVCIDINEENRIVAVLDKCGPLTEALADTLEQLTNGSSSMAFSPNNLLDALRRKCHQFMGYNQHDAQELLRQLLDSVKMEDIRRYQVHILQHFGLSKKSNPEEVDENKRKLAKLLNQKLTEIVVIVPDQVFKGTLVSTVQCTKCNHTSEVIENFLDLSLPVSFDKVQLPLALKKKSFFSEEDQTKSKHQRKKERKKMRKENRLKHKHKQSECNSSRVGSNKMNNLEIETKPALQQINGEKLDVGESGYSSEKGISPIQNICDPENEESSSTLTDIVTDASSYHGVLQSTELDCMLSEDDDICQENNPESKCNSSDIYTNSEYINNMDTMQGTLPSLADDCDDYENVSSVDNRYQLVNSPNCTYRQNNLNSDNSSCSSTDAADENNDSDDEADDDSDINNYFASNDLKCVTLQLPYECSEGECSIQSCLSQFTAREILMGNNRVCCESCTERQNKGLSGNEKKKSVYQPSTKQFLISSPPPVLILHLKRFQGSMYAAFKKVTKFVKYPLTLDIGPFCSAKCPNVLRPNVDKILYSLYGIVEHSGGLYGGHYVAYVKVRLPVSKTSYRRSFLPGGPQLNPESFKMEDVEAELNAKGSWYYISDSHVRPVSEEEVLNSQAYLLFYERIV